MSILSGFDLGYYAIVALSSHLATFSKDWDFQMPEIIEDAGLKCVFRIFVLCN